MLEKMTASCHQIGHILERMKEKVFQDKEKVRGIYLEVVINKIIKKIVLECIEGEEAQNLVVLEQTRPDSLKEKKLRNDEEVQEKDNIIVIMVK